MSAKKILPAFISRALADRPELLRAIDNMGWLALDKFIRLTVGLFVSVWIARFLGPDQFGLFSYALALVSFFGTIAGLGLNGIIVRDVVKEPAAAATTITTGFFLLLIAGLVATMLSLTTIAIWNPDGDTMFRVVAILSIGLLFQASQVFKYWFESQVQSSYAIAVESVVFLAASAIKISLILNDAGITSFALIAIAETIAGALGLLWVYVNQTGIRPTAWRPSYARAMELVRDGFPLLISGLAIFLFMRIDQLILGAFWTNAELGIYGAALRISELWYIFPSIIASSTFPIIARYRTEDPGRYKKAISKLLGLLIWFHITVALGLSLFAEIVVHSLYSNAYQGSATILAIHVWASVFQTMGIVSGHWMVYEGFLKLAMLRNVFGAVISIAMNLLLVPRHGGIGAAISTVTSVFVAYFLIDAFFPSTRQMFWLKTRSISLGVYSGPLR